MCACMLESIFGEIITAEHSQAHIHTFFLALAKTSQIDISDMALPSPAEKWLLGSTRCRPGAVVCHDLVHETNYRPLTDSKGSLWWISANDHAEVSLNLDESTTATTTRPCHR